MQARESYRKKQERTLIAEYLQRGRIPWSRGYNSFKSKFIRRTLSYGELMGFFQASLELPSSYGIGVDERCVEIPWVCAQLAEPGDTMLDAGSALNDLYILEYVMARRKKIHIITLAPEPDCYWQRGVSYIYDDLRKLPIRNECYDTIACVSTLEHVGCDNRGYTRNGDTNEYRPNDFLLVMKEFSRVLKPGGTLLLTVPFGVYKHYGSFQQFDYSLLMRAINAFEKTESVNHTFYRYDENGWNRATALECADCEYVEWVPTFSLVNANGHTREPDMAAAARSVACVTIRKRVE